MPRIGAEPIRKAALINAAIQSVGRAGSLDVTVAQIARQAGMSSALAHHYFGSKDQMFLAAMRHILTVFGQDVRAGLSGVTDPQARLRAIVRASFAGRNFERDTMAAWLHFYALTQTSPDAARLAEVYRGRLRSNLVAALRPLIGTRAGQVADTLGALIDGVYLRAALDVRPRAALRKRGATPIVSPLCAERAEAMVNAYLDEVLS